MSKLKFALIGCGRICYKHVNSLKNIENAEIVAVCDIKPERARKYAEELGVNYYLDYRTMLDKEEIDVVNVLTPSGTHPAIAIDVMREGKHVVVEKPMALKLADADRMINEADINGVKLFVVKQNRYNTAVVKAKQAFDAGRFGKLVLGTVRVRWCRNQAYYDQDAWRGTWEQDGGALTNQASHHIDLLQWFFGEVESVMAMTQTALVDIETEDTGVAILKFTSGALGVVEATTATRPKDLEGSLSILGEKATVEIGGFAVNQIKIWNFTEPIEDDKHVVENFDQLPPNVYGFGHEAYLKTVVDTLNHKKAALVDGFAGKKSIEIINAIYESSITGKKIYIHNQFNNSPLGKK